MINMTDKTSQTSDMVCCEDAADKEKARETKGIKRVCGDGERKQGRDVRRCSPPGLFGALLVR